MKKAVTSSLGGGVTPTEDSSPSECWGNMGCWLWRRLAQPSPPPHGRCDTAADEAAAGGDNWHTIPTPASLIFGYDQDRSGCASISEGVPCMSEPSLPIHNIPPGAGHNIPPLTDVGDAEDDDGSPGVPV